MRRLWRGLTAVLLLTGMLVFSPASPVGAAGVVGDGTAASCDDAALNAELIGGGLVTFNCGAAPHIIIVSEKTISADTQIDGGGLITLSGNDANRIFYVNSGTSLTLDNIDLTNGNAGTPTFGGFGGAIRSDAGTLTISNSTFSNNNAAGGNSGGFGGVIYSNAGTLTISNSTFNNNNTGGAGLTDFGSGGFGGAIYSVDSALTISNSTFSDNNAGGTDSGGFGGAIRSTGGTLAIMNSTMNGNNSDGGTTGFGGAIYGDGASPIPTFSATIMSNNTAGFGANCGSFDSVNSQGYNLTDDASCNLTQSSDIQNSTNINLGPLQDNGGPTATMLPLDGSDAIDNSACVTSQDQRGRPRPSGLACDIGSVEVQQDNAAYTLCASYYTGAVTSPLYGVCGSGTVAITAFDQSFCINPWTGQVGFTFGRPCAPPRITHIMPADGDLLTCVSRYTGANRWVADHSQCTISEVANTIWASP